MSRVAHDNPGGSNPNPADIWVNFNAKHSKFSYYDKEASEDVELSLDEMEFMFISQYHAVGGWHDSQDARIFSNEVFFIGSQPIKAGTKNGIIADGLYKEIKNDVVDAGGHYVKTIYASLKDGRLARIQLKGTAVKLWGDFVEANKSNLEKMWIKVVSIEKAGRGSIKWGNPIFEMGKAIDKKSDAIAVKAAGEVQAFFDSKANPKSVENIQVDADPVGNDVGQGLDDDLPF